MEEPVDGPLWEAVQTARIVRFGTSNRAVLWDEGFGIGEDTNVGWYKDLHGQTGRSSAKLVARGCRR